MEEQPPAQTEKERAIELAWRAVAARDRTVAELRTFLERKRVEPAAIEEAVAELEGAGYLDDVRYAHRFAEDKRVLERWGAERIGRELHRRGVSPEVVQEALSVHAGASEFEAALALLEERLPGTPSDDRERERAWRLLVRRGYEPEIAYEAVRAHGRRRAA